MLSGEGRIVRHLHVLAAQQRKEQQKHQMQLKTASSEDAKNDEGDKNEGSILSQLFHLLIAEAEGEAEGWNLNGHPEKDHSLHRVEHAPFFGNVLSLSLSLSYNIHS